MSLDKHLSTIPFYRTLGFKLTCLFLAVVLLVLGSSLFLSLKSVARNFEQSISRQFRTLLKAEEQNLENYFVATDTRAGHLSLNPKLQQIILSAEPDKDALFKAFFDDHNLVFSDQSFVILVAENGRVIYCSYDCPHLGDSFLGIELIRGVANSLQPSGAVVYDDNRFSLYSVSPILHQSHNVGFVIVGKKITNQYVSDHKIIDDIDVALVRDRAIMATTLLIDEKPLADLPIPYLEYLILLKQPGKLFETKFIEQDYYIAAKPISRMSGGLSGSIMLMKSRAELEQMELALIKKFTYIGLIFAFLILLISISVARKLLLPVYQLALTSNEIARGEKGVKAEVTHHDEFGILAENFNQMLETIEQKNQVIQAKNENLQLAAKVKDEFLANMSHEIRTPLNAVLGMAKIGVRDAPTTASESIFNQIQNSGQHLLTIINDILDFSKIEAGKLTIESTAFQLYDSVDNAVKMIAEKANEKDLDLHVNYQDDLPKWVMGDSLRLQQILINLLSNAVKFSDDGDISLSISRVQGLIHFQIKDQGIGLNDEQVARLFNPFEQADTSTTRKYGGTGLGLTISYNLAHLMGGEIAVVSQPKKGSTFTLSLPLPATQAVEKSNTVNSANDDMRLYGLTILVAEDIEINRVIIEDLLEHEGASVILAENGGEAIELLQKSNFEKIDVVLMDVQMPVMDGYEATRQIRMLRKELPVIGVTAHAMKEERVKCLAVGMVGHVTKPIDADELISVISRYVKAKGD